MNVGALVFDFDGTIADTEQAHFEGFRKVLQDEGLPLDWDLYHQRYIGFDDRGAFSARYADEGMSLSPEHLARLVDKLGLNGPGHAEDHDVYGTPFYVRFRHLVAWCVRRRWLRN